ncbi:YkoP family protein [Deinococcus planocerae]|uniref:YkoP family protein n=1 Tax=Deinococcus planocerae TaxID=1737569 RepID=UPI001FE2EB27|nr:Sectered polysaccharide deacetylase [Deinococcus planocerae]
MTAARRDRRPRLPLRAPLVRALVRAGAHGAWHGGHPGDPRLGLTVPVATPAELRGGLAVLDNAGVRATLLVPARLAALDPEGVRLAAGAGHEVAGQGDPAGLPGLDVAAGGAVTAWAPDALGLGQLRALAARGVRPLPLPSPAPEPGLTLRVSPNDLPAALARLGALGYRPVPVRELPEVRPATPRDLLIHVYRRLVDDRFARAHGVRPLTERADAVMRVALRPRPGPLPFPPGSLAAELHLHSPRLVGLNARSSLAAYRAYQRSLRDVARALRERPEFREARAVFAVTLFHGPLEKNGFTVMSLPPAQARVYGLGFRVMRLVYGTRVAPSETEPRLAWMEREAFLARHG